ncbi:MAG: hypothetical protein LBH31_10130, partial [Burkholderiaceae bacterium]|nr:hypothetical protein [Burkholderiaceae bacterium]
NITLGANIEEVGSGKLNLTLTANKGQVYTSTIDLGGGTLNVLGNTTVIDMGLAGVYLGSIYNIGGGSITGSAGGGPGIRLSGSILQQTGGTLNITGTSSSSTGILNYGVLSIAAGATMNVTGTSNTSGTGVSLSTSGTSVQNYGTLNINGTSDSGYGVNLATGAAVGNSGTLNITGTSSSGRGVYSNAPLSIGAGATANIKGTSDTNVGVFLNTGGSVTDNGVLNITGTSISNYGVHNNGTLNIEAGATALIAGTRTDSGGDGVVDTGTITVDLNGRLCVIDNNVASGTGCPSGKTGGGGGGGGDGGGAIGLVVIGGAAAFLMSGDPDLYLAAPDTLTGGSPVFWADSRLDTVTVDLKGGTAEAKLFTRSGHLKRQLKYTDNADGVNHYAWQNTADKAQAKLSVNPRTREYFYSETGAQSGQPYTVKAHGWLTSGQSGSQQAAR